jgi:hypothetical protein
MANTAFGVLEHVEEPVDLLRWIRAQLAPQGFVLVVLPDFEFNPYDLFCVDHLSKITGQTLKTLATLSDFEVVDFYRVGIVLVALLTRGVPSRRGRPSFAPVNSWTIAKRNEELACAAMCNINAARKRASELNEGFNLWARHCRNFCASVRPI